MAAGTCAGGTISCWIVSQANILSNIAANLEPVERLLTGAAYVIGLSFAVKAIVSLKSFGESRTMMGGGHSSVKEPLLYLFVAAIFIYFPTGFALLMNTTFGYSNVLAYAPIDSNNSTINTLFGQGSVVGRPLALILQTIGLIAFIRGWVLIAKSGSQGQSPGQGVGKGMIHVFGGILAMNIVGTLQIINNTLYGTN